MNEVYAAERAEYRRAMSSMNEMERAVTECESRASYGMCGDREDARWDA